MDGSPEVNFVVLGHTGFIGSVLFSKLVKANYSVCGLSSSVLSIHKSGQTVSLSRHQLDLFESIEPYIECETVIVNCIWKELTLDKRNSHHHDENAMLEIGFLNRLKDIKFRNYISFGTILEMSFAQNQIEEFSRYVLSKKRVHDFLRNTKFSFAWIRVASLYGKNDSKYRIITQLINDAARDVDTELKQPDQLLNIYHVNELIDAVLREIKSSIYGSFTALSKSWVKVSDVKWAIQTRSEPKYVPETQIPKFAQGADVIQVEHAGFLNFVNNFSKLN